MEVADPAGGVVLQALEALQREAAQPYGVALYLALFVVLYVLTVPCTILETTAGFLFGLRRGFLIGVAGKAVGTFLSFVLARTILRGWVDAKFRHMTQFRVLERMMQNSGFVGLFFTRFLPSLIKNYGMVLLDVPPGPLLLACICNIIPLSAMWAMVGASASGLAALTEGPSLTSGLGIADNPTFERFATVAMAAGAVFLSVAARRAWRTAAAQVAAADDLRARSAAAAAK